MDGYTNARNEIVQWIYYTDVHPVSYAKMSVSNRYTSTCYKAIYSISSFYRPIVYTNNYIIHVLITQAHRCRQINTTIVYIFIFFLFKIFLPLCEGWSYKQQLLASTNRKRWSICLISVHQEPAGYTGQYYPVYKGQGHTRLLHQCPDMLIIGKLHISFKQGVRFSLCSNR